VQDFTEILDCEQVSALDLTTLILVAAEPTPEKKNLDLGLLMLIHVLQKDVENVQRPASDDSTCC
jgi:hypothetical protein